MQTWYKLRPGFIEEFAFCTRMPDRSRSRFRDRAAGLPSAENKPLISSIADVNCLFRASLEQTFYSGSTIGLGRSAPARRSTGEIDMWLGIAAIFLIAWLIAFLAFHVVVAAIHILLALFVVFLIIHFVRGAARHA